MLNIMALVFGRMPDQAPFFIKPLMRAISKKAEQGISLIGETDLAFYGPQLKMNMEYIEEELGKNTWFAGEELTGAGISNTLIKLTVRCYDELSGTNCVGAGGYLRNVVTKDEGFLEEDGREACVSESGGEGGTPRDEWIQLEDK